MITDRSDMEQLEHISSDYGNQRTNDHTLDTLRFAYISKPYNTKNAE